MAVEYGTTRDVVVVLSLCIALFVIEALGTITQKMSRHPYITVAVLCLSIIALATPFILWALGMAIIWKAIQESLSLINEDVRGVIFGACVLLVTAAIGWKKSKQSKILKKVFEIAGLGVFVAIGLWSLLFIYEFVMAIPLQTATEARLQPAPPLIDQHIPLPASWNMLTPKPPPRPAKPSPQQAIPVIVQPVFGNLRQRALDLSKEISDELGPKESWPSATPEKVKQFVTSKSGWYCYHFLSRVVTIRDEFGQLHIRDSRLDDYLGSESNTCNTLGFHVLPQEIMEIAGKLIELSNKLPQNQ